MVRIRSFLIFLVFVMASNSCFGYEGIMTRYGVYLDLRGQIHSDYDPPHPENIPTKPRLQQPITDPQLYYETTVEGYKGAPNKVKPVPGGVVRYCERVAHPYTKKQYLAVWAEGKRVGNVYLTNEYAMSYFFIDNWATGVIMAKIRARKFHKKPAVFFFIEELQNAEMYEAKEMAKQLGVAIFFGTIDKQIPTEWVR